VQETPPISIHARPISWHSASRKTHARSTLNPQYLTKKQTVFQKIAAFVEKFKGVGGQV
jgi:hypothetical protein